MKKSDPPTDSFRFSGNLRHYHRGHAQAPRTWDDWVEGPAGKVRRRKNWPKVLGLVLAGLALSGIVTGLIVELS